MSRLTIGSVEIVDISVPEGATGDSITADTDAIRDVRGGRQKKTLWSARKARLDEHRQSTYLATGPIILKISKRMASVTEVSSSPT